MAYAGLAGLLPVTGLYMSILCLLGYAVSGPSRVLVPGLGCSLGPMIAATILPLTGAEGDAKRVAATSRLQLHRIRLARCGWGTQPGPPG